MKKIKIPSVRYPTRFQKVGEMYCLFISCYKKGTFPILGIGPNWHASILILIFAAICGFIMGYLPAMILRSKEKEPLLPYHI